MRICLLFALLRQYYSHTFIFLEVDFLLKQENDNILLIDNVSI